MKFVNKSTFNKMNIEEQVDTFNYFLHNLDNIKDVCNKIGISYSTIRDRFHRKNYRFDKKTKQYILNNNNKELEILITKVIKELDTKSIASNLVDDINYDKDDENKVTVRSFRLYESVLNEFINFCNTSKIKQYNILSLFIIEGMNKYKKIN